MLKEKIMMMNKKSTVKGEETARLLNTLKHGKCLGFWSIQSSPVPRSALEVTSCSPHGAYYICQGLEYEAREQMNLADNLVS